MAGVNYDQGYFSLLRWRSNPTRDEARNVAVLLFDAEGTFGGVKAANVTSISPKLREQGILDAMLSGLKKRFAVEPKPDLAEIRRMHSLLNQSLYVTDPRPCAVGNPTSSLNTLYDAYVARPGGGGGPTKARLISKVVGQLRDEDLTVDRDVPIRNCVFDILVTNQRARVAMDILTFAQPQRNDWQEAEHDAGHFLFGLRRADLVGVAVFEPPSTRSTRAAEESFGRVVEWYGDARVPILTPAEVAEHPGMVVDVAMSPRV